MFRIMLIAGKEVIARKWLKTEVPKVEDWLDVTDNMYVMERLTFSSRLELDKFNRIWENCIAYISPIR